MIRRSRTADALTATRSRTTTPALMRVVLVVSGGLLLPACASSGGQDSDPFRDDPAEVADLRGSPEEILLDEIQARGANDLTAMALIRRLRPGWLSARGRNTFGDSDTMYPVVYIDEIRHGGLGTLHGIPAGEVRRIEFFSTADATTRWGTGHPAGVINVETGR
jgi:hypothetical protein